MIIDITRLVGRLIDKRFPTGIDRVDIEYIRRYQNNAIALIRYGGRWLFFSSKESKIIFDILIHSVFSSSWKIIAIVVKKICLFWINEPIKDNILLNISHSGLNNKNYMDQVSKYNLRACYFIHDCIPISYPEYSRVDEKIKHQNRLLSASLGEAIIVNSYDTKEHLLWYAQQLDFSLPPIVVAHLGYSQITINTSQFNTSNNPYFVIIGTIEARKNHLLLLNVWRKLVEKLGDKTPKLLIIGQRGWENENAVDMIERCETIHPYIEEKQKCTNEELHVLLKGSRALLFPSFTEGYGLPMIEALSNGIPVIASDLKVFHEIAGEIPEYLDPIDGIGWIDAIIEYSLENSVVRKKQLERMIGYEVPTWENHFKTVDEFFARLNQSKT